MMRLALPVALVALVASACAKNPPPVVPVLPVITRVEASLPMVEGTQLRVSIANIDALDGDPELRIDDTYTLVASSVEPGVGVFPLSRVLVDSIGDGFQTVDLVVTDGSVESEPFSYQLDIAGSLPIALDDDIVGSFYWNDVAFVNGDGFLEDGEGEVIAEIEGMFTPDGASGVPVEATLPARQAERGDRRRGAIRLATSLGSIAPGRFVGTLTLVSTLENGSTSTSETRDVDITFNPPEFLTLNPDATSLEGVVSVLGSGFLGGGSADEVTILQVDGTFTPLDGSGSSFTEDLVLEWRSGNELAWPITSELDDDQLISTLFGTTRGMLDATFTPLTIKGVQEYPGIGGRATLTVGPVRQVVWVRLLPGFFASLPRFGLAAASGVIKELIAERLASIYQDWNVDVRVDEPTDVTPNGVTTVEVGGPDPNGFGLFGYDNSPGKDVGNLRLGDTVGGANAETLMDGSPGYGGVFIDGFLFFSESQPPGDGNGPRPDPLFDEIFAGVRNNPATLEEVRGNGERAAEVDRAIRALASMIGETTAHELGHSFGLADPNGSANVFHNRTDRPGCLMDSGSARPFGERTAQPGFEDTHLCGDNADYLDEILGLE